MMNQRKPAKIKKGKERRLGSGKLRRRGDYRRVDGEVEKGRLKKKKKTEAGVLEPARSSYE